MDTDFRSEAFYARVFGDYALFTDPSTKGGGEKFSYSLPTAQALKGIIEAAYWKPSLQYIIEEIKILKPIRTETKGILNPMNNGSQDRYYYTYLSDVDYAVKFSFIWNPNRPDLAYDHNEAKHSQILLRSLSRGGRRDIFLGTRECLGYIERLRIHEYEALEPAHQDQIINFGIQFHSFIYPSPGDEEPALFALFDHALLDHGVVRFSEQEACPIRHKITNYSIPQLSRRELETAEQLSQKAPYDEELRE